jgi:hypothetical protein
MFEGDPVDTCPVPSVDWGLSGGSSMCRPRSKDPIDASGYYRFSSLELQTNNLCPYST